MHNIVAAPCVNNMLAYGGTIGSHAFPMTIGGTTIHLSQALVSDFLEDSETWEPIYNEAINNLIPVIEKSFIPLDTPKSIVLCTVDFDSSPEAVLFWINSDGDTRVFSAEDDATYDWKYDPDDQED